MVSLLHWAGLIFILWFIPWVFVLHLGVLVYFPYEPNGQDRFMRISGPLIDKHWVPFSQIPKACVHALIAAEDGRFYEHFGLDITSIQEAMKRNKKFNKPQWGASTITQQLVKNAFLSRRKTYFRKAREMVGAVILNAIMSKEQQLTWYLNIVEFGPRVYGLANAAQHYFRTPVKQLRASNCQALVTILPSPIRLGRSIAKN